MSTPASSAGIVAARAVATLVVVGFVFGGALADQVFHVDNEFLRGWRMYNGFAAEGELCQVVFTRGPEGDEVLDRYAILGIDPWYTAPRGVRRMKTPEEAENVGKKLCRALGPGADVRVKAECASRRGDGWKTERKGDTNLCRP